MILKLKQHLSLSNIILLLIYLLAFFPIIPLIASSITLILLSILVITQEFINKDKNRSLKIPLLIKFTLLFGAYYVIEIFSIDSIKSSDFATKLNVIFLVFPLVYYLIIRNNNIINVKLFEYLFVIGSLTLALIAIGVSLSGLSQELISVGGKAYALRTEFENITRRHPTYASLFICFSSLLLFSEFLKKYKVLYLIPFIVLVIGLLLLSSRIAFIALIIGVIFVIKHHVKHLKSFILVVLGILIIGVISIFYIQPIKERSTEILTIFNDESKENSTNIRKTIYECSFRALDEHWVTGVGFQNVQFQLDACYFYKNPKLMGFNTHNEYLNVWIGKGILGFSLFIGIIILGLAKGIKEKHVFYFFLIVSLFFLTESILQRQLGQMFYVLFICVYAFRSDNRLINNDKQLES